MRRIAFTLVPLLLFACDRQPVAPDAIAAPQFQATTEWRRYSEVWDPSTENVPCRGTDFSIYGELAIRWHIVKASAERVQYQLQFLPTAQDVVMEEVSTSTVFKLKIGNPDMIHYSDGYSDGGGTFWGRQRWTFVAPNGDEITRIWFAHFAWNADWEATFSRDTFGYECKFAKG